LQKKGIMERSIKVPTNHISRTRREELTNYFLDKPMTGILTKIRENFYVVKHTKLSGEVKSYTVAGDIPVNKINQEISFTLEGDFDGEMVAVVKKNSK
jgi:hypothetical protein